MDTTTWIQPLAWTLVHTIWQGSLIALAAALALPRIHAPVVRYRVAMGGLILLLVSAVATFGYLYEPSVSEAALLQPIEVQSGQLVVIADTAPDVLPTAWSAPVIAWLEVHQAWIVGAWIVGAFLLLLRLAGGLWHLRRIEARSQAAGQHFNDTLRRMAATLRVPQQVRLLESAHIQSPATFGWLRPVILLPIGLVNQLSAAEVEAILMHEMAHLSRRDWLAQLTQAVIEALMYYHPAVWWLSGIARHERERCADALALEHFGDQRVVYAKALLQAQAYAQQQATTAPALALCATGTATKKQKSPFFERIQTILLQPPQQKSLFMERTIAAALLVAALTCWGAQAAAPLLPDALMTTASEWLGVEMSQTSQDTLPPDKSRSVIIKRGWRNGNYISVTESTVDGKMVKMTAVDGKVTDLKVDDKEIPEDEFIQYKSITDKMMTIPPPVPPVAPVAPVSPVSPASPVAPVPPMPPMPPGMVITPTKDAQGNRVIQLLVNGELVKVQVNEDNTVVVNGEVVADSESIVLSELSGLEQPIWIQRNDDDLVQIYGNDGVVNLGMIRELRALEQQHLGMEQHHRAMEQHHRAMERQQRNMEEEHRAMEQHNRAMEMQVHQDGLFYMNGDARGGIIMPEHGIFINSQGGGAGNFQEAMVQSMIADYLITDPDNYSIELSSKKLKVNGKKQPENMLKKYLDLYEAYHSEPLGPSTSFKFEVANK
jgi:bla regulator protein blaR1